MVLTEEVLKVTGWVGELSHTQRKHVTLAKAEKVLMQAGAVEALSDGRVRVIPNPHWSTARWRAYMASRGCDPDGPGWEEI